VLASGPSTVASGPLQLSLAPLAQISSYTTDVSMSYRVTYILRDWSVVWRSSFKKAVFHQVCTSRRTTVKSSSSFAAAFRGINPLDSAFITLRWYGLAHIHIQVISLRRGYAVESKSKFLIGNRFRVTMGILNSKILFKWNPKWKKYFIYRIAVA